MAVEPINRATAIDLVLRSLAVESATFYDDKALAALLRHAASHRCPVTPRELLSDLIASAEWLLPEDSISREKLGDVSALLVASGDLIEGNVTDEAGTRRTLFLGPPTFVPAPSGLIFLLGIRPDGLPLLNDDLMSRVEQRGALRVIQAEGDERLETELVEQGLRELSVNAWIAAPRIESHDAVIRHYSTRLDRETVGGLDGFRVIDSSRPVDFYKGRWRELQVGDRGLLVGRREQAFGADLWCCLDVIDDMLGRFIDLPVVDLELSGADEAWRLQSAIDRQRGAPQVMRLAASDIPGSSLLVFYGPLPSWAQRRLDALGTPAAPARGGLFAYAVSDAAVDAESEFFGDMLWIEAQR